MTEKFYTVMQLLEHQHARAEEAKAALPEPHDRDSEEYRDYAEKRWLADQCRRAVMLQNRYGALPLDWRDTFTEEPLVELMGRTIPVRSGPEKRLSKDVVIAGVLEACDYYGMDASWEDTGKTVHGFDRVGAATVYGMSFECTDSNRSVFKHLVCPLVTHINRLGEKHNIANFKSLDFHVVDSVLLGYFLMPRRVDYRGVSVMTELPEWGRGGPCVPIPWEEKFPSAMEPAQNVWVLEEQPKQFSAFTPSGTKAS